MAALSIDGAVFHLHEITAKDYFISPDGLKGTTVCIGLFVPDVDRIMNKALRAGATR